MEQARHYKGQSYDLQRLNIDIIVRCVINIKQNRRLVYKSFNEQTFCFQLVSVLLLAQDQVSVLQILVNVSADQTTKARSVTDVLLAIMAIQIVNHANATAKDLKEMFAMLHQDNVLAEQFTLDDNATSVSLDFTVSLIVNNATVTLQVLDQMMVVLLVTAAQAKL